MQYHARLHPVFYFRAPVSNNYSKMLLTSHTMTITCSIPSILPRKSSPDKLGSNGQYDLLPRHLSRRQGVCIVEGDTSQLEKTACCYVVPVELSPLFSKCKQLQLKSVRTLKHIFKALSTHPGKYKHAFVHLSFHSN